jgi:hypothetical protein
MALLSTNICMERYYHECECDSRRGLGLDIGFGGHFNTQHVITLNCSATTGLHTFKSQLHAH